jgi:hypothetical protein
VAWTDIRDKVQHTDEINTVHPRMEAFWAMSTSANLLIFQGIII